MTHAQAKKLTLAQRRRLVRKIGERVQEPWALYWGEYHLAALHNPDLTDAYRVLVEAGL